MLRAKLGPLKQTQVEGFTLLLDEAAKRGTRWDNLSNILATAWWETAHTMQPVAEAFWVKNAEAWRKKNLRYWPFYGRGYVQLTWDFNYAKATKWFRENGIKYKGAYPDFTKNPELAMVPELAATILFVGMEEGWFTGKKLTDYLDGIDESDVEDLREFTNARRIVNGTDKQVEIGKLSLAFEQALKVGRYGTSNVVTIPSKPVIPGPTPQPTPEPAGVSLLATILEFLARIFTR